MLKLKFDPFFLSKQTKIQKNKNTHTHTHIQKKEEGEEKEKEKEKEEEEEENPAEMYAVVAKLAEQIEQSNNPDRSELNQAIEIRGVSGPVVDNYNAGVDNKLVSDMLKQTINQQLINKSLNDTIYYTKLLESEGRLPAEVAAKVRAHARHQSEALMKGIRNSGKVFSENDAENMQNLPFQILREENQRKESSVDRSIIHEESEDLDPDEFLEKTAHTSGRPHSGL